MDWAEQFIGALILAVQGGKDPRRHTPYPYNDYLRTKKNRRNKTMHAQQSARLIKNRFV